MPFGPPLAIDILHQVICSLQKSIPGDCQLLTSLLDVGLGLSVVVYLVNLNDKGKGAFHLLFKKVIAVEFNEKFTVDRFGISFIQMVLLEIEMSISLLKQNVFIIHLGTYGFFSRDN